MQLWEHEWLSINELIYKLYSDEMEGDPRANFLSLVRLLLPYTAASFFISLPEDEKLLSNGVGVDIAQQILDQYLEEYIDCDYGKWMYMTSDSSIFRTSDWFPDNVRETSLYYKKVLEANGLHYELRMSLYWEHSLLGIVTFFRSKSEPNFSDKDIFILEVLKKHLILYTRHHILCRRGPSPYDPSQLARAAQRYDLTDREEEVLRLLLAGESNIMVAQQLCISPNTQKKHTMNIYKKLNVRNRTELLKTLLNDQKK